jgi:PKD repeat protein
MRKFLPILLSFLICLIATKVSAQITVGNVNPGPYGHGSNISVPFTLKASGSCFNTDNKFQLFLSDVNGSFASETKIGEISGFFSTYINGTIPSSIPSGNNYKLRVKSTAPGTTFEFSGTILIVAATGPIVGVTPSNASEVLQTDAVYGFCGDAVGDNKSIILKNNSSPPTRETLSIKNESTGNVQEYPLTSAGFNITNLSQGYFTITVTGESIVDGVTVMSIKSYLLLNTKSSSIFGSNGVSGCIDPLSPDGANISYSMDVTGVNGIQNNYPGTIYRFTWGDGTVEEMRHCELINNGGVVNHSYKQTSCGQPPIDIGNGITITNSFRVSSTATNQFCVNSAVTSTTYTKIYSRPIAAIDPTSATAACINTNVVFTNKSKAGNNSDCSITVAFKWYVDGVLESTDETFIHKFTTAGIHTVKLVAANDVNICAPSEDIRQICIQNPPKPSFNFNGTAGSITCAPGVVKPTNTSIIDENCNTENTYKWTVTGGTVTYTSGTSATSKEPEFNFATPGVYKVKLSISTASCGMVDSEEQTIVVNGPPVAILSPDIKLCNIGVYNFNNTTFGKTKTELSGSFSEPEGTYKWEVSGGEFTFETGTSSTSKYPDIKFTQYVAYTVKVTHTNSCGTTSDTQVISFTVAPVVSAGLDQNLCFKDNTTLAGTITGTVKSFVWQGGAGIFSDRNSLTSTYTPTAEERASGIVTLILHTLTDLEDPCNTIDDEVILHIKPEIKLTNAATAISCTGNALNFELTATPANTTFSWTATGSTNASGFNSGSGTSITDVLSTSDATINATVTYLITPVNDGCTGDPFTLTVTVTPKPILTATAGNTTICNNQVAAVALTSNLADTRYTWTSVVTGSITGNTNKTVPENVASINDLLLNSGTTAGTVTYAITAYSANNCEGSKATITINIEPSVTTAVAGPDENICSTATYTLNGNLPTVGIGKWTLTSGLAGVTFADDTKNNTTVNGLQSGQNYVFRWTITGATSCNPSFDEVTITVNQVTVGGVTSGATEVCSGNNEGIITLTGQTGSVLNWESSVDNGATWIILPSTSATYTYSNLTTSTQFRAVVKNGNCPPENSAATTVIVTPGTVVAIAGADQILCTTTSTTLTGNNPGENSGFWTLTSAQTGVNITTPTSPTTTVTGLVGGQNYLFTWTITGSGACPPTTDVVEVSNLAAIVNTISTSTPIVCSGQTIIVSGAQPTGGDNTYTYLWESSVNSGGTWNVISGQTERDLNFVLTEAQIFRRTVFSSTCSALSNTVNVVAQPPISNNVISSTQSICIGSTPTALTGTTPAGGDGRFNYQWQSSTDGITWTNIIGAVTNNRPLAALTQTTSYRRLVSTAACTGSLQNVSNTVIITVNPNAQAEFTFTSDAGCAPYLLTAENIKAIPYADRNGTYTWFANNVEIGTGLAFPGYTITESNAAVEIKLLVSSSLGCSTAEMLHTFTTPQSITPSFTKDKTEGCGSTTINFTNTTPVAAGSTYEWDFGNGSTSQSYAPIAQTYLPEATGKDTTYIITLKVNTPCGSSTITTTLLVKSFPVSVFSPNKTSGCSPFTVTFSNTSPGTSNTYYYDFGDGTAPVVKTDKSPVTHTYTTPITKDFIVKMIAENSCGRSEPTQYTLRVSPNTIVPELVVNSNEQQGCAPLTVNFQNNTSGANSFTYDFGDGTTAGPTRSAPETVPHVFAKGGTYIVTLTASNGCSTVTTTETIVVYNQPLASFKADKVSGCSGLTVSFKNTSTDGFSYIWDFGDGSPTSSAFEPQHIYEGTQEYYTVKLTATNASGCTYVTTANQFIHIVPPPVAKFNVLPAVQISIPKYNFSFEDESENTPDRWEWDFGDGTTSSVKNPSHIYSDTGHFTVKLKVTNQEGCFSTTEKTVSIIGVPGYLFVPNAFMPASATSELREFKAKGSGIDSWTMSIFDKWGQLLWKTDKLDEGKPVEGWDGTFKSVPVPQGVYYWKIDVQMTNGTPWKGMSFNGSSPKRTGAINLIR